MASCGGYSQSDENEINRKRACAAAIARAIVCAACAIIAWVGAGHGLAGQDALPHGVDLGLHRGHHGPARRGKGAHVGAA